MEDETLTDEEHEALQAVADQYGIVIDIVGSRAAARGRNIHTDLPVGKGPGTRSDIDVRIHGDVQIRTRGRVVDVLKNIGGGDLVSLVSVGTRSFGGSYDPKIEIRPRRA
jgi:hypothetical protein